jgi:hypothetical protein
MEEELLAFELSTITYFIKENADTLLKIMDRDGGSITETINGMLDEQLQREALAL